MENEICRACDGYRGEETFVQDLVGNLNESDHLEYPGVDGDNIKVGLKVNRRVWSGLIWLRIGTSSGCYGNNKETSFYVKLRGIS
jgi:hypothetical protein